MGTLEGAARISWRWLWSGMQSGAIRCLCKFRQPCVSRFVTGKDGQLEEVFDVVGVAGNGNHYFLGELKDYIKGGDMETIRD